MQIEVLDRCDKLRQFFDCGLDIVPLLAHPIDLIAAAFYRNAALLDPAISQVVKVDHFLDLGQTEPDVLGAHDPSKPGAVALGVYPGKAYARR